MLAVVSRAPCIRRPRSEQPRELYRRNQRRKQESDWDRRFLGPPQLRADVFVSLDLIH
jgi:hypothetical protein